MKTLVLQTESYLPNGVCSRIFRFYVRFLRVFICFYDFGTALLILGCAACRSVDTVEVGNKRRGTWKTQGPMFHLKRAKRGVDVITGIPKTFRFNGSNPEQTTRVLGLLGLFQPVTCEVGCW